MSISQISIISTNTNTDVQIQRADTREPHSPYDVNDLVDR
ncbi:hypothetical protein CtesDRAFT_PD2387 [Comamonas testosteroni KF-1]|uniref:Uncharacterized protein n=1 Tax=Comamonas testosteroni (strain DSM 14576 / KF-1) TaxID=399795 RepID=B7WTN5_COMTK|nr:hypothetical protein CtesDRAFT_PD2387 [Comamonas testosteroni KF-1]PIG08936.1 hypothetical protein CLU84_1813 [Comamonas sp. 26]